MIRGDLVTCRACVAVFAVLAATMLAATAVPAADSAGDSHGVRWANELFTRPEDLARWLGARGASYELWAVRHPLAADRLAAGTGDGVDPSSASGSRSAPAGSLVEPPDPASSSWVLLGLSGVALAAAALLALLVAPPSWRGGALGAAVEHRRREVSAAALSLLVSSTVALVIVASAS